MAQTTKNLRLTMQETNDNPDTWGDVANNSVFKLIEDAVVKREELDVTITNPITLSYGAGTAATNDARAIFLDVIGSPGGAVTVEVPVDGAGSFGNADEYAKPYLVRAGCGYDVTVKVTGQTGVVVPDGQTRWVYCDGTDVFFVNAGTVTDAVNSTNADNLLNNGAYVAGDNFARTELGVGDTSVQTFSKGQNAVRVDLTQPGTGGTVTLNNGASNAFRLTLNSGTGTTLTVGNPTVSNADADGQVIRLMVHDQTGGVTVSWGTAFAWASGTPPTLSGAAGKVDYLAFEYFHNFPGGGKWVGAALLDVS